MHEQVVGLVVKAPLAHHEPSTRVLAQLHHVCKVLLLLAPQLLKLLDRVDVHLMLGLGLWGLKRACEDSDLHIGENLGHLRVGKVLVDDEALHEACVLHRAADLALNLDEVEVDVAALKVGDSHDRLDADLSHVALEATDAAHERSGVRGLEVGKSS
eukprot:364344-Chlamydomonas_euryale.AAC.20